jgi:hypothetical protein
MNIFEKVLFWCQKWIIKNLGEFYIETVNGLGLCTLFRRSVDVQYSAVEIWRIPQGEYTS